MRHRLLVVSILTVSLVGGLCVGQSGIHVREANAQDARSKQDRAKQAAEKKTTAKSSRVPKRQLNDLQVAKVHSFVIEHMPELQGLLRVLKENNPNRYMNAVRELHLAVDRLARLQQRDEEAYALALKSWQLDKQAQLLAARSRMDGAEKSDAKLRDLLNQRFELEAKIRKRSRDKLAARLAKLDEDLERFEATRADAIDKQIRAWRKTPSRATTSVKTRGKSQ